ncbi:hypothetical protein SLS53_000157 [Cytospora paraplurivora]|uniref:Uncharacterized protein n=1 Tax=Cytospora paraplurivora TaxID=2898453 RepID=A0AAN9UM54_9PEZI
MLAQIFSTLFLAAAASAVTVSYDTGYDLSSRSLTVVSCSDGTNGLITKYGYQTQGDIPDFPYIGGADVIAGWNSASLTYGSNSIKVLAIDHAASGFNIGEDALNALTNNQAEALGRIDATATQLAVTECGLP